VPVKLLYSELLIISTKKGHNRSRSTWGLVSRSIRPIYNLVSRHLPSALVWARFCF
jgi:hypothetical protein